MRQQLRLTTILTVTAVASAPPYLTSHRIDGMFNHLIRFGSLGQAAVKRCAATALGQEPRPGQVRVV